MNVRCLALALIPLHIFGFTASLAAQEACLVTGSRASPTGSWPSLVVQNNCANTMYVVVCTLPENQVTWSRFSEVALPRGTEHSWPIYNVDEAPLFEAMACRGYEGTSNKPPCATRITCTSLR